MSRVVETVGRPEDNRNKYILRKYVLLLITLIMALALVVAIVGYIMNGGILPNDYRGPIDFGTLEGKVIGPTGLPAVGASVIAEKDLEVMTSMVKEGGYTANSFVKIDGTYSFKVPSGIYKISVAFPDGTNQIIENYAIWPSSSSSFDFKYI
jgi:hypothetical protein